MKGQIMRQAGYAFLIISIILVLAGCQSSEDELSSFAGFVRQSDWPTEVKAARPGPVVKNDLPELTDTSPLEDYLVYAAFNNPGHRGL